MNSSEKFPTFIRWNRYFWKWANRWVRPLVRPVFFTLVCLITLVALVIAEENYRTGKAWEKYQSEAKTRGVKFTLAELAPPPVPDDQNFAMTPLLKQLYTDGYNRKRPSKNLDVYENADADTEERPNEMHYFGLGDWSNGERVNLAKWTTHFQYFHQPDILTALKKYDAELTEISVAVQRPYSHFPFPYDKQPAISIIMPEIASLGQLAELYELRGLAELADGKSDAALADTVSLFKLSVATRDEPTLIAMFVRTRTLDDGLQVVWEGLEDRIWTEAQIAKLQQEIQKIDLLPQIQLAGQGERALFVNTLEWLKQQNIATREKNVKNMTSGRDVSGESSLDSLEINYKLLMQVLPFSLDRALLLGNEYMDQYIQPAVNLAERRFYPDVTEAGEKALHAQIGLSGYLPGRLYLTFCSSEKGSLRHFAHGQTSLDEAAIACALERFRLAHGNFPEKLEELVPQYIAQLPHDMITGKPLHYQRTDDGNFVLYSTGWDGIDRQGNLLKKDEFNPGIDNWIWRYPEK